MAYCLAAVEISSNQPPSPFHLNLTSHCQQACHDAGLRAHASPTLPGQTLAHASMLLIPHMPPQHQLEPSLCHGHQRYYDTEAAAVLSTLSQVELLS